MVIRFNQTFQVNPCEWYAQGQAIIASWAWQKQYEDPNILHIISHSDNGKELRIPKGVISIVTDAPAWKSDAICECGKNIKDIFWVCKDRPLCQDCYFENTPDITERYEFDPSIKKFVRTFLILDED